MSLFNSSLLVLLFLTLLSTIQARVKLVGTPVIFTNNNGGGADELQVPPSSEAHKLFSAGGKVIEAWWVPFDNIGDLSAIHRIEARPSGDQVQLVVHGLNHQRNGRVRIKIYAEVADEHYIDNRSRN